MSTTLIPNGPQHELAPGGTATTSVPFTRLVRVELRKLHDTRSGAGLLIAIGLVTALVMVLTFFLTVPADLTYLSFLTAAALPQGLLLPILGILAVTGEWSQRTTMTTFVLEPRRARVATAKLLAAMVFALLAVLVALAAGAVANLLAIGFRGADGDWSLDASVVGGAVLMQLISVAMGVAFGMAVLQSTLAIVSYLLLPTIWSVANAVVARLDRAAGWLDVSRTGAPFYAGEADGLDWCRLGTSVAVWVGIPLAIGYRRWTRREVS